jgi:rubrerythrin
MKIDKLFNQSLTLYINRYKNYGFGHDIVFRRCYNYRTNFQLEYDEEIYVWMGLYIENELKPWKIFVKKYDEEEGEEIYKDISHLNKKEIIEEITGKIFQKIRLKIIQPMAELNNQSFYYCKICGYSHKTIKEIVFNEKNECRVCIKEVSRLGHVLNITYQPEYKIFIP